MSTEADIVTPDKLRAMVTSDHKRGCQGREYGCSCGYDDDKDAMIERAAVALEQLRAERDAAAREMRQAVIVRISSLRQHEIDPESRDLVLNAVMALPDTPAVIATEGDSQ